MVEREGRSPGLGERVVRAARARGVGLAVREGDLGVRTRIGGGAASDVHRLETFTVPGHDGGLAFVRARETGAAPWHAEELRRMVAWRWGLDARELSVLDGVAAWPVAVVEDEDGDVVGALVPLAESPFYYVPAEGAAGKTPQSVRWLVSAPKRARRAGAAVVEERDLVARSTVLARVCVLLDLLHRHGIVYGDLSDRIVLIGIGEVAEALVVGCEGAVFGEGPEPDSGLVQRNSAGWVAPESLGGAVRGGESGARAPRGGGSASDGECNNALRWIDSASGGSPGALGGVDGAVGGGAGALGAGAGALGGGDGGESDVTARFDEGPRHPEAAPKAAPSVQTAATDRYKLGLLVLRVLAPAGDGLARSRDAGRIRGMLDATGERMLADALGDDPEARPAASEWYTYLRGMIVAQFEAPVIERVTVTPALVAEGDEVRLEVTLGGARQLTIEMPGRADITREVSGRSVLERFTARQSGRIGVRAANEHGETRALSEMVRVLPVPAAPSRLPAEVPDLDGLGVLPDLGALHAALGIAAEAGGAAPGAETAAALDAESGESADRAARAHADGGARPARSPYDQVAALRAALDADAVPLHELIRIGVEAERISRDHAALFPPLDDFLGDITARGGRRA